MAATEHSYYTASQLFPIEEESAIPPQEIAIVTNKTAQALEKSFRYHPSEQTLTTQFKKYRGKKKRNKKVIKAVSIPLIFAHTSIFTAMTIASFHLLFPQVALPALLVFAAAGFLIDGLMFFPHVIGAVTSIFGKGLLNALRFRGLFSDLLNYIVRRNLGKASVHDAKLSKFFAYLDKETEKEITKQYSHLTPQKLAKRIARAKADVRANYLEDLISKWRLRRKLIIKNYKKSLPFWRRLSSKDFWHCHYQENNPLWRKSNNIELYVGSLIETGLLVRNRKEFAIKKALIVLGLILVAISGVGFACMAITHIPEILLAVFTLSATALWAITIPSAILGGFIFSMLMYRTLSNGVKKNLFKRLVRDFGLKKDPEQNWAIYLLATTLKAIPITVLASVGVVAMILMAGAWLDAVQSVILTIVPRINLAINFIAQALIFGVMMPVNIIFSITHSSSSAHEIAHGFKFAGRSILWLGKWWLNQAAPTNTFRNHLLHEPFKTAARLIFKPWYSVAAAAIKNPGTVYKGIVYGIVGSFVLFCYIIHLAVEASMTAGEGAEKDNWVGKMFQWGCRKAHVDPVKTAVVGSSVQEGMEHADFVIQYMRPFAKPFYQWPKKLFRKLKEPKVNKPQPAMQAKAKPLQHISSYKKILDQEQLQRPHETEQTPKKTNFHYAPIPFLHTPRKSSAATRAPRSSLHIPSYKARI